MWRWPAFRNHNLQHDKHPVILMWEFLGCDASSVNAHKPNIAKLTWVCPKMMIQSKISLLKTNMFERKGCPSCMDTPMCFENPTCSFNHFPLQLERLPILRLETPQTKFQCSIMALGNARYHTQWKRKKGSYPAWTDFRKPYKHMFLATICGSSKDHTRLLKNVFGTKTMNFLNGISLRHTVLRLSINN